MSEKNLGRMVAATLLTAGFLMMMASIAFSASAGSAEPLAGEETAGSEEGAGVSRIGLLGMEFEGARRGSIDRLRAASNGMLDRLEAIVTGGIPKETIGAALMLEGEILSAMGDYDAAAEIFRRSAGKSKNGPLGDDALFYRIKSLEAAGRDETAKEEWSRWLKHNPESPLVAEARLASVWNALRRGEHAGAASAIRDLVSCHGWMAGDPRVDLALGVIAFHGKDYDGAISHVSRCADSEAGLFLEALCRQKMGDSYRAAVVYQEMLDRHPDSRLRGYAFLAKGNLLGSADDYRSAAGEFALAASRSSRKDIRAESEFLGASCVFLAGGEQDGIESMRDIASRYRGEDTAARAQFALGEMMWRQGRYEESIVEFNRLLSEYFDHMLAGSALYRTARCFDALGRQVEANGSYQAVAAGHPYAPEAPAAVYLAGVGLLEQGLPLAAAPYFQLVLDRYGGSENGGIFVFESTGHQELAEAALCLLEYAYHQAGDMGQLSGAPHLVLRKMPPSRSLWRAYALLMDADALAARSRYPEAQETLKMLFREFPDHPAGIKANRLLAWTYARQGRQDLAIETEERMLARYQALGDMAGMSDAALTIAHASFNSKDYEKALAGYNSFIREFPGHREYRTALYQAGLCDLRLGRPGDAVDEWERIVAIDPADSLALLAWRRAADLYFHTGHFDDARRCYGALVEHGAGTVLEPEGLLSLARCDYNEGFDEAALGKFRETALRFAGTEIASEAEAGVAQSLYRLGLSENNTARLAELVEEHVSSPLAPDAQFEIAMRFYEEKDYARAAAGFRRLVNLFPAWSAADRAWFLMAESFGLGGLDAESREAWEKFPDCFPGSALESAALFRLGKIRFDNGEYTLAAGDFKRVLETGTDGETRFAAVYNLGMSYRILRMPGEAADVLRKYRAGGIDDDKRMFDVTKLLGEIFEEEKMFEKAAEEYAALVRYDSIPDGAFVELNYRLGFCRETLGLTSEAVESYRAAMEAGEKSDPFRLSAVARAAALHERTGDFRKALSAYRDLITNSRDAELALAARERASQIESALE